MFHAVLTIVLTLLRYGQNCLVAEMSIFNIETNRGLMLTSLKSRHSEKKFTLDYKRFN